MLEPTLIPAEQCISMYKTLRRDYYEEGSDRAVYKAGNETIMKCPLCGYKDIFSTRSRKNIRCYFHPFSDEPDYSICQDRTAKFPNQQTLNELAVYDVFTTIYPDLTDIITQLKGVYIYGNVIFTKWEMITTFECEYGNSLDRTPHDDVYVDKMIERLMKRTKKRFPDVANIISDVYAGNIGYDMRKRLKFCDMGTWGSKNCGVQEWIRDFCKKYNISFIQ